MTARRRPRIRSASGWRVRVLPALVRLTLMAAALLSAARCGGGSPTTPPPPPVPQLALACPNPVEAQSPTGEPVAIAFSPATATGGVQPVSVTCSLNPGTPVAVGTTAVSCTALDARGVSARCDFTVKVVGPPRLRGVSFVAFGDSITAGKLPPGGRLAESEFAYTFGLERRLRERYSVQQPIVVNEGISAEKTYEGGLARLPAVLQAHRPDALLLMEGSNDLLDESGISAGIDALRHMIQFAKQSRVTVFLATVPPQRPVGFRAVTAARIPRFNEQVRQLAVAEEVVLVDVYDAMKDDIATLISSDDLHPSPHGLEAIADAFFKAIVTHFEEPPMPPALQYTSQSGTVAVGRAAPDAPLHSEAANGPRRR